jgi:NAD(P)-dependent dehydrogenase (short-subunit alcohol dehydrogenase family)
VSKLAPKGVHLLVNNHGIAVDDHTKFSNVGMPDMNSSKSIAEHLWKSDPQSWMDTWETNVMSPFFVSAAFIPLLSKASDMSPKYSPSIINITSISGLMKGSSGGQFAYASSKAAFIHLNRQLATTLTNCKIRVNTIAPGIFPSEMTAMEPSNENQKSSLGGKPSNAAKRYGNDADMAATVLYLAGPGGCFLNNQIITLDGGHTLTSPAAI